jgi:hypothetical protein
MHNERCTSGSEGERQKPTVATSHGADARPLLHDSLFNGRRFRALSCSTSGVGRASPSKSTFP